MRYALTRPSTCTSKWMVPAAVCTPSVFGDCGGLQTKCLSRAGACKWRVCGACCCVRVQVDVCLCGVSTPRVFCGAGGCCVHTKVTVTAVCTSTWILLLQRARDVALRHQASMHRAPTILPQLCSWAPPVRYLTFLGANAPCLKAPSDHLRHATQRAARNA